MSRTVWGSPLIGSAAIADPMSDTSLIADLNNWIKQGFNNPVEIKYDPSTRTNRFSYTMIPGDFERMYYKFKIEPETHYIFAIKLGGKFTEENTVDGTPHRFNMLVTREIIDDDVFTDRLKPTSSEEGGIVVNSYAYGGSRLEFTTKRDFGLPFFTYKQRYADGDPRNDEESEEDEPTGDDEPTGEESNSDESFVYLYLDFSAVTDYEPNDIILKDVRCVPWEPGLLYLRGPICACNEPGDVWHFIAAYPGAWIWPFVDDFSHTMHIFALAGDPFKVIDVATHYEGGYLSTSYKPSEPVVINGRTYHQAHMKITDIEGPDIICHLTRESSTGEVLVTDDEIYDKLSDYVRNKEHYNFIKVLDRDELHSWLDGGNGGSLASMFGLTSEEFSSIMKLEEL